MGVIGPNPRSKSNAEVGLFIVIPPNPAPKLLLELLMALLLLGFNKAEKSFDLAVEDRAATLLGWLVNEVVVGKVVVAVDGEGLD